MAAALVACDGEGDPETVSSASPSVVFTGGPGPYVSVAVDNHFHDVHPVDDKEISADVAFVVRNEGSNLHNVTFPDTEISVDIEVGESWRIDPVGELGGPGTYTFFCKYHASDGMRGRFTVVED
jgi:Cupredoxin-like domain